MSEIAIKLAQDEGRSLADDLLEAACWAEGRGRVDRALRLLQLRERWLCLSVTESERTEKHPAPARADVLS